MVRTPSTGRRRISILAFGAALCAFALAPQGASALTQGCTQTSAGDPATETTEWTCLSTQTSVEGFGVKQRPSPGPIPKPNVNGHITHMEVDVVDPVTAQPVPIDRLMLHHIVFFNAARPDAACGGPERFYGAGEERAKISLPDGYGYPLNPSDPWFLVYMYMNHRAQTDTAWIEYKLTVEPAGAGNTSVRSYWMDVGNCDPDPIYNVPGADEQPVPSCAKLRKAAKRKGTKKAKRKARECRQRADAIEDQNSPGATHFQTKDVTAKENGWIIGGWGHVHGGAEKLTITKPSCGNMQVAQSDPTWGNPDHPFYNVKPVLHEPGPIGMSAFTTPTGIPIRSGQAIRLNSVYDNDQPHSRVMGIEVLYVAPDAPGLPDPAECGGAPSDIAYGPGTNLPGRSDPPPFKVPLIGIQNGQPVEIDGPPGAFRTLASGSTVQVGDRYFGDPNVVIPQGASLNYQFLGSEEHNVTLANGPMGIGSPRQSSGTYTQTFTRPGTYRFFCELHPTQMTERVVVEPPKAAKKKKKKKTKKKARKRKK